MTEYAGNKNRYTCDLCYGEIITITREEGVTPFMLFCKATEGCKGTMQSSFYRVDQLLRAEWEWYKPANLNGMSYGEREHIRKGGLVLQRIPPRYSNIDDPLLRRIVVFIEGREDICTSDLQRQFRLTYMTAARLLDELVARHFVESAKNKKGRRKIIKRIDNGLEIYADRGSDGGDQAL